MFTHFELSFEYREGLVLFSLFRDGITQASQKVTWESIEPALSNASERTLRFDSGSETESDMLQPWTELVATVIGQQACRTIVAHLPVQLTIAVDRSIPAEYQHFFLVTPWDHALAQLGGISSDSELVADRSITVIDVRLTEAETQNPTSAAGIELVPASMDYHSEQDDAIKSGTTFPVWFGTNRRIEQRDGKINELPSKPELQKVSFGKCSVWIPKTHRRGEQKSPWYMPHRLHLDDALRIVDIELTDNLVKSISKSQNQANQKNHLLFIHGFNSSFTEAITRAAQIGFDLGIDGATIAFSWPSRKLIPFVSRYVGDGETISASQNVMATLAKEIAGLEGTLHIIAHSMGNRALTQSWRNMFDTIHESPTLNVGQVVFAAPDVYQQAFLNDTKDIHAFCQRATLYANRRDYALGLSRLLSQTPRAGMLPPVMPLVKIDTIEVSFHMALFGHTYFAKLIPMLEDLSALIEDNCAPGSGRRETLHLMAGDSNHWKIC